jgi:hypothetical protein
MKEVVVVKLPINGNLKNKSMLALLRWFQRNVDTEIKKITISKNKEKDIDNDDDEKDKIIFKVTCDIDSSNEKLNKEDFHVTISKGVTGTEMSYAISALLSVIIAHENSMNNKLSIDGFLHYIGTIMKESEIGLPKGDK